jgi:uncharacterized membrane protein YkvA (DUF1232 family)
MSYEKNLDDSVKKAEKVAKDPVAVAHLADRAQAKARKAEGKLKGTRRDLELLIRLVRAWASGKYKDVSLTSIVVVIAAVVYFVNPFDAIPDFLPLLGYSDDLSVVGFAILRVRRELDKFRDWEQEITLN